MRNDRQTKNALLGLVADIRAAVGDPKGKLMQDELVEHCRKLAHSADWNRRRVEMLSRLTTETSMNFEQWWHEHGSGVRVADGQDCEEHARKVAALAWNEATVALDNRAAAAESVIDWLRTQAVADIAPGFVGIPQVEWDAVFAANDKADPRRPDQ